MNHVLLFGARGHLARTKIIPSLHSQKISYTPLSRKDHIVKIDNSKRNIAYMSIPTQHVVETIKPYEDQFMESKPLFILEKPHGTSFENFVDISEYFRIHNFRVLYNDHYIAKNALQMCMLNNPEFNKINIKLHESDCINDRVAYFEGLGKSGILLDMYQSHVMIMLSTVLANIHNVSRTEILEELALLCPYSVYYDKYPTYIGSNYTQCIVKLKYKDIDIEVSCGKQLPDEKSMCLVGKNQKMCLDFSSKENPYDLIFEWVKNDNTRPFLNCYEIELLWNHMSHFNLS